MVTFSKVMIDELRKNAIEKAFLQTLQTIKSIVNGQGPNCFISHAWKGSDPGEESGFDLFALKLKDYLMQAGIYAFYDEKPLKEGRHTVPFMNQVGRASFILVLFTKDYKDKSELSNTGVYQEVKKIEERLLIGEEFYIPILLSGEEGDSIPSCLDPMGRSYEDFRDLNKLYSKFFKILKENFLHKLDNIDIDAEIKLFKDLQDEYEKGQHDGDLIEVWKAESAAIQKKALEEAAQREEFHKTIIAEQLKEASSSLVKSISSKSKQQRGHVQGYTEGKTDSPTVSDNYNTLISLIDKSFIPPNYTATIISQGDFIITPPNLSSESTSQKLLKINPTTNLKISEDGRLQIISGQNIDEKILARILSQDGRTRIIKTGDWPYRVHGHLIMTFSNGNQYVGSGTMVGPSHVLTAGHNLYSHNRGEGWATKVTFIPAQNGEIAPWGKSEGVALLSVRGWVNNTDPRLSMPYDMGMVILDKEIGKSTGWLGLLCGSDKLLEPLIVNVTGYPGDKGEPHQWSTQMWTMGHRVKRLDKDKLYYDIDTFQGQSGSGLWAQYNDGYYAVGIHAYGEGIDGQGNSATRITEAKIKRIIDWLNGYYGSLAETKETSFMSGLIKPDNLTIEGTKKTTQNVLIEEASSLNSLKDEEKPDSTPLNVAAPSSSVSVTLASMSLKTDITTLKQELTEIQFIKTLGKIHSEIRSSPSCFISYAWGIPEHEKLVHKLAGHLKEAGIGISLDIWDNKAGTRISRFTEKIDKSDYIILVGSKQLMKKYKNEKDSAVLNLEIDQVIEKLRVKPGRILPILLDGSKKISFPSALGTIVYIDFREPENYYPKIFELIGRLLPDKDLSLFIREFTKQRDYLYSENISFEDLLKKKKEAQEKDRELTEKAIDNTINAYKDQLARNYNRRTTYYESS